MEVKKNRLFEIFYFSKILRSLRIFILDKIYKNNMVLLNYNYPERRRIFEIVKRRKSRNMRANEAYQIYVLVRDLCKKYKGDLAEVGVFKGDSAMMISEAKGSNNLYLFDTFEGLPNISEKDKPSDKWRSDFVKSEFSDTSLEEVKRYLSKYPNVHIYKGIFPKQNSEIVKKKKFMFIHLDVDLYSSTYECLKFFYPRMKKGGIILTHDYSTSEGVKKAFDEFFKNKKEVVIELASSQGLVICK